MLVACLLACGCNSVETNAELIPPVSERSLRNGKDDKAIRELQRLYAEAKTESARRALFLRAIDAGLIRQGGPVFTIDQILGTHYDDDLPLGERTESHLVLFADQPPAPPHDPHWTVAWAYFGSYMDFEYDSKGILQQYYFTNLHKGRSSRRLDGKAPLPVEQLRQAFVSAKSEAERRDVCLLAIDEGVIETGGPGSVSAVDAIFGTHLASDLPSRKESRWGVVDFSGPYPVAGGALGKMTTRDGSWLLVVEYSDDGSIWSYYLTNLRPRDMSEMIR